MQNNYSKKILRFMRRNLKYIIPVVIISAGLLAFFKNHMFQSTEKDKYTLGAMTYILENYHYSPRPLNDTFSVKLFYQYIKAIDPSKRYFLQEDIDSLSRYKYELDDQIKQLDFTFFNTSFSLLMKRQAEARKIFNEIISNPIDLNQPDSISWDYDKIPFPQDKNRLRKRWERFLKYSILTDIAQQVEAQKDSVHKKTDAELLKSGIKTVKKNFTQLFDNLDELTREDYLAVYFNTIAELYDPHTNYFKPEDKDRFDTSMSGSFEGIGARLQKEGAYTKIIELIPGGPAWRGKKLEVGDIILKVRQENEQVPVDVVGMRLDKIVKLIKGKKGTKVFLTVKKLNGKIVEIPIVRDRVILEETFAKSLLIKDNSHTIGYTYLPKFYHNFRRDNDRNSASDIKKELEKLNDNNVDGLILDLRNNGGGSLQDVIDIAGYFIKKGPVVQVQNRDKQRRIYNDPDPDIIWEKPVVVLVNELSASASEILAAALQDYKRAIIIGGKQTYGKGTVQKFVDLSQISRRPDLGNLGSLKWTTQKFFRINGSSTQKKGVRPDIDLPDRFRYIKFGEKDQPTALPFSTIQPADYTLWNGYQNFDETIQYTRKMADTMQIFKNITLLAKWVQHNSEKKTYPLKKDLFLDYVLKNNRQADYLDSLTRYQNKLQFQSLPQDTLNKSNDTVFLEKRKRWIQDLQKDPYLEVAVKALEKLKLKNEK